MRRVIRVAAAGLLGGLVALSALLAENALHVWNHSAAPAAAADAIARQGAATWRAVEVAAEDGVHLKAWLLTPSRPNGAGVILMHGVADTRIGMSGHALFLLRAGYTVLLPDSRGHGESAGGTISYGISNPAMSTDGPTSSSTSRAFTASMLSDSRWARPS